MIGGYHVRLLFASAKIGCMGSLEEELQKMYDSEIHVDIGWLWDGGIDVSIGNDEVKGHVETVAQVLPWLQDAIAKHYQESKYNVEREGGVWTPKWVEPQYPNNGQG
jgi:hypothetical protein